MAGKDVSLAYAEGTGSFLVLLAMAEQQRLFGKYGVDVRSVAIKGATVPRLTADMPLGMIGEPAALLQVAEGADLRLVASFSDIKLSGHLVARPGIKHARRFARQAPGSARDRGRTVDINDPCPRTVGARSTARRNHHFARRQSGPNFPRFGTGRNRRCASVSRTKSRTTGQGVYCPLEGLPARHKQLWRWAGCLQWLSVEQSRCGFEGRARTSRSPGDVPWRTAQGQGHAGVQRSPQHHRRRKRCKQFRRAATQAVSFIGSVGKDAESDLAP